MRELEETHQTGLATIENLDLVRKLLLYPTQDFGIQIAKDGRVWICINGIAFIRFKPEGMGCGEVLPQER